MTMSVFAYLIPQWRTLSIVTSVLGLGPLILMLFVPESPRWLIAKQKYEQADHVIHKIVIGKGWPGIIKYLLDFDIHLRQGCPVMFNVFLGNGHTYKDKYRQTPPSQTLEELKVDHEAEDLNLNSLGKGTKIF